MKTFRAGLTFKIFAENFSIRFNSPSRIHDIFRTSKDYKKKVDIPKKVYDSRDKSGSNIGKK